MPERTPLTGEGEGEVVARLRDALARAIPRPLRLMEVCGTHTMAFFETGLRPVLRDLGVTLISGPGCPVCVTAREDVDHALALAALPEVDFCTFGDMVRVPGSAGSLADRRAAGAVVRVVYSPLEAVEHAAAHPARRVVFFGVGFETTAPAVAFALTEARRQELGNFYVYPCLKTIPLPMLLLARHPRLNLDGFICPGHVSVITGEAAYYEVAAAGRKPCVITGFTAADLLQGVLAIARQVRQGEARVENAYGRAVRSEGNPRARAVVAEVFQPADAQWRGLGLISGSGLSLAGDYMRYDARALCPAPPAVPALAAEVEACRCGDVLAGLLSPPECPLFGTACTPETPAGPCMVSREGSCQAYYRYGGEW